MSMETLVCSGVCKNYGNKEVLKDVDLTLEKGKIYGLIGRNGAGKTTLLSILSAQNPLSSGCVEWNGERVWENQRALNHICFSREIIVNPNGSGVSSLRIKDYLNAAACYFPYWDAMMAGELLETFELKKKDRIAKLSKGQMSMVTIIVAMASKADFTFLDEPVAGLDVVMREYFYRRLLEEYAESGRTFVVSTHIIEEAADVFEEVIMIKKGKLLLKENTQNLVDSAFRISGLAEVVDEAAKGYERHHEEKSGRSKSITVFLKDGQMLPEGYDVTIQPLNLQNVFIALCGLGE